MTWERFVALLPEQGQERQVVWWLFQTGNWRPALSPRWLGGDPDQGIWLLCPWGRQGWSSCHHISLLAWTPEIMESSIILCAPESSLSPVSKPFLQPPGHPSSPSPGPCLQDQYYRCPQPLSSLFSNVYQLKDVPFTLHLLSTVIIYMN